MTVGSYKYILVTVTKWHLISKINERALPEQAERKRLRRI